MLFYILLMFFFIRTYRRMQIYDDYVGFHCICFAWTTKSFAYYNRYNEFMDKKNCPGVVYKIRDILIWDEKKNQIKINAR